MQRPVQWAERDTKITFSFNPCSFSLSVPPTFTPFQFFLSSSPLQSSQSGLPPSHHPFPCFSLHLSLCLCFPCFNLYVLPASVSIPPSRGSGPALWLIIVIPPWGTLCLTPGWLPWRSLRVCVCVCVCQGANGQLEGITSLATGITGTSHTQTHADTHMYMQDCQYYQTGESSKVYWLTCYTALVLISLLSKTYRVKKIQPWIRLSGSHQDHAQLNRFSTQNQSPFILSINSPTWNWEVQKV